MGHPKNLPDVSSKEISMDHDKIKAIIKALNDDYDDLVKTAPKYAKQAIYDNTPPEAAMGDYTAGRGIHSTYRAARDQIGGTYGSFLDAYKRMIKALEDSEKNMRKADDKSKTGNNNVGGGRFAQ